MFTKPSGGWGSGDTPEQAKLTVSNGEYNMGIAVSISGDGALALVGASGNSSAGAAYVFAMPTGGWGDRTGADAVLTASTGSSSDVFGAFVSISNDGGSALVGADQRDSNGAAFLYVKPSGGWENATETKELTASDGDASDYFGYSVSLSGNGEEALVGAYQNENRVGAAYVYRLVPELETTQPTGINSSSATVGGTITSNETSLAKYGVCVGTSESPTACTSAETIANNVYSMVIDDLEAGTTYYVRAFATNDYATGYGEDQKFSTAASNNNGAAPPTPEGVAAASTMHYVVLFFLMTAFGIRFGRKNSSLL